MADIVHDPVLRRQVQRVENIVEALGGAVAEVDDRVQQVSHQQAETKHGLDLLHQDFLEFREQTRRDRERQFSATEIGRLQDEIEHAFGHYKEVRNSAVGMLQAFDVGLVSEETVRAISEQLMVRAQRYWLAPVLVALAAWAGDDRELCGRAVTEAYRRSPGRTSLLMALILRRQGRRASAVRWLRHYLDAQDPDALNRDFAVILEAVAQGAFGPAGLAVVREVLDGWQARLLADEAAQQAQVRRWRAEIEGYAAGPAGHRYPRLAEVSPQWPALETALGRAQAHRPIVDRYTALLAEEITPTDRIEDAVDDILDRLVREYDDEELPHRRELAYHRAVVDHRGDVEEAKRTVSRDATTLDDTRDYLTIQTDSALNPAAIGVSRSTQRVAVAACHDWFARAHATYTMDYRAALPQDVQAVLGPEQSGLARELRLPPWHGSFTDPMDRLERSLVDHLEHHSRPYLDGFVFNWGRRLLLPAAAVLGTLILVGACANAGAGLLVAAAVGGIWVLVLRARAERTAEQRRQAREHVETLKQDLVTQLRAAGAELADWSTAFREADAAEAQVRTMLGELATAGSPASPHERRTVAAGGRGEGR